MTDDVAAGTKSINAAYTISDHEARNRDSYAHAKYDLTLRWLRGFLEPGMVAFNIGCGGGYFNGVLRRHGLRVTACEPDQIAYELALRDRAEGVTIVHGDLQAFREIVDGRADVIVMHDVLEHIQDDAAAAPLLATLLKPGGKIILSVPALQSLFGRHDEELGHYRRYSKASLRKVVEPHFKILRLRYYGMASIPIVLVFSKLLRRPYPVEAAQRGVVHKIYGALCKAETYLPEPIGSSVICELTLR